MSDEESPVRFTVWINYRETIVSAMQGDTVVWENHNNRDGMADIVFQIILYLHIHHGLLIGRSAAEHVLKTIGSVLPLETERSYSVSGRNLETGQPYKVEVTTIEIRESIQRWATGLGHYLRLLFDPHFNPTGSSADLPSELHQWLGKYPILLKSEIVPMKLTEFLQEMIGYEVIVAEG